MIQKLTKNMLKNSVKTLLNEWTLQLCRLKNKTLKTKHTQFKIKLKICGKLDWKSTKND